MRSVEDLKTDRVLIIAAEASSCMYAKLFIKQWRKTRPNTEFFGVGDKEMQQMGVKCLGYAEDMAVVGLQEVAQHWSVIKKCFQDILSEVEREPPQFSLLLDYPGFNLRLAKSLKPKKVPVVYYISPQLWAWKKGRVKQVRDFVDHMMVVFPFEVDFYREHQVEAHFVGHPLVEVVEAERQGLQARVADETPVLGLMPGSRKSEIKFNLRTQLQTARKVLEKKQLHVKLLLAPTLKREDLLPVIEEEKVPVEFLAAPPTQMISQCDFILTASGTATLQVALCEKPMVVMYRMNPVTAFFAKLLVRSVDAFCIVNLIAGRKVVPELFQGEANPQRLSEEILQLLTDQNKKTEMLKALSEVKTALGGGGATKKLVEFLHQEFPRV